MEHATAHHTNHQAEHRHPLHHRIIHRVRAIKERGGHLWLACFILAIALVLLWILVELAVVGGYALVYRVSDLMAALYMRANPISMNFVIVSIILVAISPLIAVNFYQEEK